MYLEPVATWTNPRVNVFESDEGFSVEIIGRASFPEVTLRYIEGRHTMDVFAEALASPADFAIRKSDLRKWSAPHDEEGLDDPVRDHLLENIRTALAYGGYVNVEIED
jgi:hypothetical protein